MPMAKSGRPLTQPDVGRLVPRMVAVDDPTWNDTLARAEDDGVSAAEVTRRALRAYLRDSL